MGRGTRQQGHGNRTLLMVVVLAALAGATAGCASSVRGQRTAVANAAESGSTGARVAPALASMPLARAVGQLVIASYPGVVPPASLLRAVGAGEVGGIILMGPNTAGGPHRTAVATAQLQRAARAGGWPGLLIMTDQEGGEVKRLIGPPRYAAARMSNPAVALSQGSATGRLLRGVGVNLDLAPVADVSRVDGFITQEDRSFGTRPAVVARAACAFARGLASQGVAYTLKHFPGLGDTVGDTDNAPVSVTESARSLSADGAAYRRCGHSPMAAVMVSSASYVHLTGDTPAVMSAAVYRRVLPSDGVTALTISDSFESGSISDLHAPARRALNAGLDMVMYPHTLSLALSSSRILLSDVRAGSLSQSRVRAAAGRVLELKATLGIS